MFQPWTLFLSLIIVHCLLLSRRIADVFATHFFKVASHLWLLNLDFFLETKTFWSLSWMRWNVCRYAINFYSFIMYLVSFNMSSLTWYLSFIAWQGKLGQRTSGIAFQEQIIIPHGGNTVLYYLRQLLIGRRDKRGRLARIAREWGGAGTTRSRLHCRGCLDKNVIR